MSTPSSVASSPTSSSTSSSTTTCPSCGVNTSFTLHLGFQFCNKCGKKLLQTPPGKPVESKLPNASAATPASSNTDSQAASAVTPPRNGDDDDDDDNVVTFKHALQSPAPAKFVPDRLHGVITPDTKGKAVPLLPNVINAPSSSTVASSSATTPKQSPSIPSLNPPPVSAAASSSSSSSSSASSTAAPTITLTEQELVDLEANIRKEALTAMNSEAEILNQEFDNLSKVNQQLQSEKTELQKTMEEMMESFNSVVEQANQRRSDFTAQVSILETELTQLRTQHDALKSQHAQLKETHTALQNTNEEKSNECKERTQENEKLRGEFDTLKATYDKLRQQATEKITAGGNEYRILLQKNNELETKLKTTTDDNAATHKRLQAAELRLKESDQERLDALARTGTLESSVGKLNAELNEAKNSAIQLQQNLTATENKLNDSNAVGQRYKDQLVSARERLRELESSASKLQQNESKTAELTKQVATVNAECLQLKSQLFDAAQTEKALKAQITALNLAASTSSSSSANANPTASVDAARIHVLETELNTVRNELALKEREHSELMTFCNDLISQLEQAKAEQAK